MRTHARTRLLLLSVAICLLLALAAQAAPNEGKIPITTDSKAALKSFMTGRDLFERLQNQEALGHFTEAVRSDPNFAMGYLYMAQTSTSAKDFFANLDQAKELAPNVSEAEQLWINGVAAGTGGDLIKQRDLYTKLATIYPDDERAQNLLGNTYFIMQDYATAIEQYKKSINVNPDFSQPYNQMGYAYRFVGNYEEAEKAFKKYVELIPDDPNPYDSYAELLMKMGRYDESISNYQKALEMNPHFVASHTGIATNLMYKGEHQAAREQLMKLEQTARNDGERRTAHFVTSITYCDQGRFDEAVAELNKQYAIAEKLSDYSAMGADLVNIGNVLLEAGRFEQALAKFRESVKSVEMADVEEDVKEASRRGLLYNEARVALAKGDLQTATATTEQFGDKAKTVNSPFLLRQMHELKGMIAYMQENFETAVQEFRQANLLDPYNVYRLALACNRAGDQTQAKMHCRSAANFNNINSFNCAFVRHKARRMMAEL